MTALILFVALAAEPPKFKVEPVWTFYPVCLRDKRTGRVERGAIRCLGAFDKPSPECLANARKNSDPALEIVECGRPTS